MISLEAKLGHTFKATGLLQNALTHSSYANESRAPGDTSNERLEFLGDSVLGMVVASKLYRSFPDLPEGRMTKLRAQLVCEESLYRAAQEIGLGEHMRLGKGEERMGGRSRPSILADATEALIAALYLDGGLGAASAFVEAYILRDIEREIAGTGTDYKTRLQELVQKKSGQVLLYQLLDESGPDHDKIFTAQVTLNGRTIGTGEGHTKKEAEQNAAGHALESLSG